MCKWCNNTIIRNKTNSMITSWSDEDLEKLSNPNNHRIRWDNIEYHWEHKINGHKWEPHCIDGFEDWKKPYHYLRYWIYQWSKELADRRIKLSESYFYKMGETLKVSEKVIEISNNEKLKNKEKIRLVRELLPNESVTFMSSVLGLTRQCVHKHL
jgi:hypothetical protein